MEIQWPLLIFSVLLGVTSGSFVFLAVGELRGKFREVRFTGALIAFICLAVGGCVSVLHMGHPERATHLLGNLGSGLSKELFVVAIMGIVALVYLILAKKDYPGVSKVFGILGGVILALGRCVGEVAALIFTAGSIAQIPNFLEQGGMALFDSTRTLAVHMYVLASEGLHVNETYATAVVLLVMVVVLNLLATFAAKKMSKGNQDD